MSHTETVERSVTLDAAPDEVWEALTDPDRISDWFGARVEWDLEPGGRATFVFPDGRTRPGRIDRVRPPHELAYHYLPIETDVDGRSRKVPGATVEIFCEPVSKGRTRVVITESASFLDATGGRFSPGITVPIGSPGRRIGFQARLSA